MEKYIYAAFSKTFIIIGNFSTEIYLSYFFSRSILSIDYFALSDFTGLLLGIAVQIPLGRFLDSKNKKNILILNQIILSSFLISAYLIFDFSRLIIMYVVSIVLGLFSGVSYSTTNSILRHLSDGMNTSKINGYSEIFGQLPSIFGGIMFLLISGFINFRSSFIISSLIDLSSIFLILFIPYDPSIHLTAVSSLQKSNKTETGKGFKISNYGSLTLFAIIMNIPFIMVVTGNFLYPIYIVMKLHRGANFIAIEGSIYAFSALFSGIIFPKIQPHLDKRKLYMLPFSIFSIGIFGIAITKSPFIFLSMSIFLGLGNGSSRILRNTMIMRNVENRFIGRYNTRISSFVYLMRAIFLLFYFLSVVCISVRFAIYVNCLTVSFLLLILYRLNFQENKIKIGILQEN
ncbi:MFS transporter [Cuniculiplasma sp. SKW3]|uniref:MFS transporter n=1 Tax=unclassified Cuniculiplasma TaxID=2619706 RepID=UPI003FD3141B